MKEKRMFSTELAYVVGIVTLALGTTLMEKADFGMSMVVAPAYLLYLKLSESLSWFTFGMAEYCLQAILLLITMAVLRKWKPMFLFSFLTAVIYGIVLDGCMLLGTLLPVGMAWRVAYYFLGMIVCALGVAMLFHTYIAPEAYELLVKEISAFLNKKISVVKTVYDCCSCLIAVVLSFVFFGFGHFEGVKLGTIFCALVNGWIIGQVSRMLENGFEFRDVLRLRKWFK